MGWAVVTKDTGLDVLFLGSAELPLFYRWRTFFAWFSLAFHQMET